MLSGMKKRGLEGQIDRIKGEIAELGPLRPGTLYQHTSVCGKPGCRCGRKSKPERHGPYHYLSYTLQGKSHTEFVTKGRLREVKQQVRNYQRLMALVQSLVEKNLRLCKRLRRDS